MHRATAIAAQNAGTLATAVQAITEGIRTGCADPGNAIALLTPLAQFMAPTIPLAGSDAIGAAITTVATATAAACRQAAIMSIALAETTYQPTSYQDAVSLRTQIVALIDAEMLVASYATSLALRTLRAAVVADLTADALALPEVITVSEPMPRPALAVAYQLYGDPSRYNDLVARVNPINPNAMPLTFEALAS